MVFNIKEQRTEQVINVGTHLSVPGSVFQNAMNTLSIVKNSINIPQRDIYEEHARMDLIKLIKSISETI